MALSSYDSVAEKILLDLEAAVKKDTVINEFDVIPTPEHENRNSSPILKGECSLGLESWIIRHIYPYAHHQILQKNNYKAQNLEKVMSCLMGVVLLNPEMSTAWNRRRDLILSRKMQPDNELRITRMALSRKPKSNEALAHRRWIITEFLKKMTDNSILLKEELSLCEMIANRYHSNYHAWSHRIWSLQHLLPEPPHSNLKKKSNKSSVIGTAEKDTIRLLFCNISKYKYLSMINSENFFIYCEEMETNFKWVSCHVSDHSGFHFRKFLINEICNFLKSNIHENTDFEKNEPLMNVNIQYRLNSCFFPTRKVILTEFLKAAESNSSHRKVLDEYLVDLEHNTTLFDLVLSIVISEIKSNHSLCLMFPGHEAIWYYRRCLIHMFKEYILDQLCSSEQAVFNHQDKNGVPHRKDLKYDYTLKPDDQKLNKKLSDLFCVFYNTLLKNEEDVILSALKASDENQKKIVKCYETWFKFSIKIKENVC